MEKGKDVQELDYVFRLFCAWKVWLFACKYVICVFGVCELRILRDWADMSRAGILGASRLTAVLDAV